MKRILYKSLAYAAFLPLLTLASCNYEEINTNPYEMTEEMGVMEERIYRRRELMVFGIEQSAVLSSG